MNISTLEDFLATGPTFNLKIAGVNISPTYINAGIIVLLIFILVLTLAQVRHHLMDWSLKGAVFGVILGFILALLLEGFLLVGGKTVLTGVLGWKNPPKPISTLLDKGRDSLIDVLGISDISINEESDSTLEGLYGQLSSSERERIRDIICR